MPTLATVLSVAAFALSVTSFIVTLVFTIKRDIGPIRPALVFTYRSGVGRALGNSWEQFPFFFFFVQNRPFPHRKVLSIPLLLGTIWRGPPFGK